MSRVAAASIVTCGSLFLGAVAGQAAPPLAGFGFRTPSGNIVCNRGLATTGAPGVSCVAFSESSATRGQASWLVGPSGRARFRFVLGNIGTDVPVLAYGRSWRRYRIVCVSRSTGLTCRNPAGHGFTLEPRAPADLLARPRTTVRRLRGRTVSVGLAPPLESREGIG